MAQLQGRQWGLVAIVSGSPLFLAALLAVAWPELLHAAVGTALGGLSWAVAALLGCAGGALYASWLGRLEQLPALAVSPARRSAARVLAALPCMGLCVVPAVFLLVAGPAFAAELQKRDEPLMPETPSVRAAAEDLAGQVLRNLPKAIPVQLPGTMPW